MLVAELAAWSRPGLCSTSAGATATREKVTENFRAVDGREQGRLYLDPRLPGGIEARILEVLAHAEAETQRRLGARPERPLVFVYFDQQLMKAAACINDSVVAFYDGALHVVAEEPDLQQSVTHEYAHHALFGSGLSGPAWAQEGIAMIVARERWWQRPALLQQLLQAPFAAEQMDSVIPYKLPTEQAVTFYVQSALTVQCLRQLRGWSLHDLAESLRRESSADMVKYDLPELEQNAFLSRCVALVPAFAALH